jgi:hypothetical protein
METIQDMIRSINQILDGHTRQRKYGIKRKRGMSLLQFIHAFTCCDTTSRIYGLEFRRVIKIFSEAEPDKHDISVRGEEALILLNNGIPLERLVS